MAILQQLEQPADLAVSVIIPALDAARTIERCVRSAFDQAMPAHEVIVVDNGCRDATASIAARAGARVVTESRRGRSRARNRGVSESNGSLLAFLDADCQAPPDWLSRSVAALRLPWLAAVQARVQKSVGVLPGRSFTQANYYWPFLDTCALLTTRAGFDAAGGFDEELARNEDMDFSFRLLASGVAFGWVPDAVVLKDHELNSGEALRRGWGGGQSLAVLSQKWRTVRGISGRHFLADLSKGVLKAAFRDARRVGSAGANDSLEAVGQLFGCLQGRLSESRVRLARPCSSSRLSQRLGSLRFLVVGPDETLLFDASKPRLRRLSPEEWLELERYICDDSKRHQGAEIVRQLGLEPSAA